MAQNLDFSMGFGGLQMRYKGISCLVSQALFPQALFLQVTSVGCRRQTPGTYPTLKYTYERISET